MENGIRKIKTDDCRDAMPRVSELTESEFELKMVKGNY